jgi:hypothetical protein
MKRRCDTCEYWEGFHPRDGNKGRGKCRKRSPQIISIPPSFTGIAKWPITHDDDWCGDYERVSND